jgi:tRNA threonylcarbamoyladenosine biosynthesis protein TsaB
LLIETSMPAGLVGMAVGGEIVSRTLDPQRRQGRDLAPIVAELLRSSGVAPTAWGGVVVGLGPGSFTGLRVGVMSAKTFAYVTGSALRAVPTFALIAEQTPPSAQQLWVVADALRGQVYAQLFHYQATGWHAATPLQLFSWECWRQQVMPEMWVSGPGAELAGQRWPELTLAAPEIRLPTLAGLYAAARRFPPVTRQALYALEPLYIRPSYAEERIGHTHAASHPPSDVEK